MLRILAVFSEKSPRGRENAGVLFGAVPFYYLPTSSSTLIFDMLGLDTSFICRSIMLTLRSQEKVQTSDVAFKEEMPGI